MNKHRTILFLIFLALLAALPACQPAAPATEEAVLTVSDGTTEVTYTAAELEALAAEEVTVDDVTYVGVPLATLLEVAGVDPASVSEVTAVASDDFSAAYTAEHVNRPDTLVAYGTAQGDLGEDEQPFRMVLPEEEGRLNVRMLSRIEVSL
jgi:hypothetical protein